MLHEIEDERKKSQQWSKMSKAEKANVKVLFSKLMNYSRGGSKVSDEILFWI